MNFAIGKDGIASIDLTISLDRNSMTVRMMQPYENKPEFHQERDRICDIFEDTMCSSNSVEVSHGSFSEKTVTQLKRAVDVLNERSIIDLQRRDEIMSKLEEMVAQVKIECERETEQYASLLMDFKTCVESPYKGLNRRGLMVDNSINQLNYLISDVCLYRGNPMKVGSRWLYLCLSEGALENLIKSLQSKEHKQLKEGFEALHRGVTSFLQKYESEIYAVIEKTITKNAPWFQQLYKDYVTMIKTGKSPAEDCYGPITNMDLGTFQLYPPSRFANS